MKYNKYHKCKTYSIYPISIFNKLRIWLVMFICPKDVTVIINARDKYLNRTIHIWGRHTIYFLKCCVSTFVHISKVKPGFREYCNVERQLRLVIDLGPVNGQRPRSDRQG